MKMTDLSKTFWQQGYLVMNDFFSTELMDSLQNVILEHYGLDPDYEHEAAFLSKSATEVIPWFPQRSGERAFDNIERCEKLSMLTEAILGKDWKSLYCMSMFSKKAAKAKHGTKTAHPIILNNLILTALFTVWISMNKWVEKCQ